MTAERNPDWREIAEVRRSAEEERGEFRLRQKLEERCQERTAAQEYRQFLEHIAIVACGWRKSTGDAERTIDHLLDLAERGIERGDARAAKKDTADVQA